METEIAEVAANTELKPAAAWPFPTQSAPAAVEATAIHRASFITIPQTTLPNGHVEPAFQVGQYLVGLGPDEQLEITASARPLVDVNYQEARDVCAQLGGALITETQALVLAYLISNVPENYIGDMLMQGLHSDIGDYEEPLPASHPEDGAGECRAFQLPDGAFIFDAAGNAYTWVFDNVQGDVNGLVAKPFDKDSLSISLAPHPSMEKGVGWYPDAGADWSGSALMRGGCWCSVGNAGVFNLDGVSPGGGGYYVGVRCTKPVGV